MAAKKSKKKNKQSDNTIAVNRQASHEFFIEEQFEAGLVLEGWEVKSLREGRIQLKESHIVIHKGEAWLLGAHISPLLSASTHIVPDRVRRKKLLLHKNELYKLIGAVERKGYTIVPLSMYWIKGRAKLKIGLAKGKKLHDKRAVAKDKDWQRDKERLMKHA
ncbi:MAG: SsrA-binding protein SmpB [Methylococcales bacterium]|nr:SsrA-binding protein SmpB [Methylococcales bacterium]